MEKVADGRRRKARRGRERESWSEVGVRVRLGVNYISVCWHVARPFLPMYMFGYERVRANRGSFELSEENGKTKAEEEKREREDRTREGVRSMRGLALHWHAARSTISSR